MKKLILLLTMAVVLATTASAHTRTNYMQDVIDAAVAGDYDAGYAACGDEIELGGGGGMVCG